jgi:hypothetical protein
MPFPSLTFANLLENATRAELEQLVSLFVGYLSAQHKEDGSHSDITADSVTVAGDVTATGSGVFGDEVIAFDGDSNRESGFISSSFVGDFAYAGVNIGGTTSGAFIELRGGASPYTTGNELAIWLLGYSTVKPIVRFGSISGTLTMLDGGSGSSLSIGHSADPIAEINASVYSGGETGTWTPILNFGGATTGITYSVQSGTYTRITNVVTVEGRITLTSKGAAAGTATITGLPFAANLAGMNVINVVSGLSGLTGSPKIAAVGSTLFPQQSAAAADSGLTNTEFTNTTDLRFSVTYRT